MNNRLLRAEQLLAAGQFEEAEKLCRGALKPGKDTIPARRLLASCLYNRSVLLLANPSFYDEAEALLREAARMDPQHIEALHNLAALMLLTHRPGDAVPFAAEMARRFPGDIRALQNLALAQEEADQHDSASVTLHKLAALDTANNGAYLLRDALLSPAIPPNNDAVHGARRRTLERLQALDARTDLVIADPLRFPSTYFRFTYHGPSNLEINRLLARVHAKACPSLTWTSPALANWPGPDSRKRIRIGIASRFLRAHSVGSVARGFFEHLDRAHFEVTAVRLEASNHDETAREIDRLADAVLEIPAGLEAAREALAKQSFDVLFYQDIGMEPLSYFLAFARLAPLQLTWFGHPDTSGIPTLDAYVSTNLFDAEGAQDFYTEKLVSLHQAGNMSCYRRPPTPDAGETRAQFGLKDGQHLYCCPQLLLKIQPVMDRLFTGILERDPEALILLFAPAEKHWQLALEKRFAAHSVLLKERVRFLPSMPYARFLRLMQLCDVALDTVTFNGFNTTLEALTVGTPVVTLAGPLQRQRFGSGLYQGMGYTELVAQSEAEYVDLAVRLAADPVYRDRCMQKIAAGREALFENVRFIREFENAVVTLLGSPGVQDALRK